MKVTQKQVKEYIKNQLSTNSGWAIKALVRIFEENQTSDEQTSEHTKHDNGIGFSGIHAEICSSFAKQLKLGRTLSPKQLVIVHKIMPKYHGQVLKFIGEDKAKEIVGKILQPA